ncbi:MAG TPA: cupin domain-containing protein [Actinomycetota bacterium]
MEERLARRPRVIHETEVAAVDFPDGSGSYRLLIDPTVGARHVMQFAARIRPGARSPLEAKPEEEAMYVVSGLGRLTVGETDHDLQPGSAALIPSGTEGWLSNVGDQDLHLIPVVSPPMGTPMPAHPAGPVPAVSLHEMDQPAESAGEDREFRVLIDPRHGAQHVTQFVGFIDRSRAPFHTHTYEEAIYVLDGEGVVHVGGDHGFDHPIRPGSSIFLPPGTPHCLENAGAGVLKLLGVFSPPGSPGSKQE